MSIWGSLIGGFVGFSFAGPIGALIGSILGGRIAAAKRVGFQKSFTPPKKNFFFKLISPHFDQNVIMYNNLMKKISILKKFITIFE